MQCAAAIVTVIATWKLNGSPVIIGDILLSQCHDTPSEHIKIPTRDDVERILPPEYYTTISGLNQKIYIISDTLVIGLSGAELTATILLNRITEYFKNSPCSIFETNRFLESCQD